MQVEEEQGWKLDGVGNWEEWWYDGEREQREHNEVNELVRRDGEELEYDGNGNLVFDGTYRYEWDAMGRLRRVRRASDGVVVGEYVYDHLNRRLLRRADVDGDGVWDAEVRYVYAGWRVVEERDAATGRLLRDYVYGNYIDEVVQGRYDREGDGVMDEVFYFVHNSQYSISALTDAGGAILEHYRYLPYGEVRVYTGKGADGEWFTGDDEEGSFSRSMYAFTGRRYDPESGLYYFRNRYYAPELGRFITRDPAGYVDGLNMYRGYFVPNGVDGMGMKLLYGPTTTTDPRDVCCVEVQDWWQAQGFRSRDACVGECTARYWAFSAGFVGMVTGIGTAGVSGVWEWILGSVGAATTGFSVGVTMGCTFACERDVCTEMVSPKGPYTRRVGWLWWKKCEKYWVCGAVEYRN